MAPSVGHPAGSARTLAPRDPFAERFHRLATPDGLAPAPLPASRGGPRRHRCSIRRQVFYLPGFDPRDPAAYWGLFRREARRSAERRGTAFAVGEPVRDPDGITVDWTVETEGARTRYTLLRWDDLVRKAFPKLNWLHIGSVPLLWGRLIANGHARALRREGRRFSRIIYGVHVILALVALAAFAVSLAVVDLLAPGLPGPVTVAAVAGITILLTAVAARGLRGKPLYIQHLVDDTAFTHRHARTGGAPGMAARLDAFAERILAGRAEADEILLVGHSSGSFLILEALDRALARDPTLGRDGPPVVLLTLGSVVPWITLDPAAAAARRSLAAVADASQIPWYDIVTRWDALSFHDRDPIEASGLPARPGRVVPVEVPLRDLMDAETRKRTHYNLFSRHFQLLMASLGGSRFDYVTLVAGPEPAGRFLDACRASAARA